jgi:FAD/FMN-containing dehydrogenase
MIPPTAPEASREFMQEIGRELGEVRFDRMTRLLYSTDASIYQMMPVGVAFPRDADQVVAAVEIAGRHAVPVLPRGSGSSLDGQAVGHALVLDLTRHMDQVLEIDPEARRVRTQPGITLGLLNQQLRRSGLMYGPDPASAERATMGGVLGNNSTGAHSVVYGMTVDHVLECEAVLADGSRATFAGFDPSQWAARGKRTGLEGAIYRQVRAILERYADPIATRYPKTFRTVAGYSLNQVRASYDPNLARLLVGSEGTLAVFTAMTVNLVPVPKATRLAIVHFSELRPAMEAVPAIMQTGPSAVEVMDRLLLDLTRDRLEYRRLLSFVEGNPGLLLAVEYSGASEAELAAGIERLQALLSRIGHREPVVIVADPAQQAKVWFVRKVGLGILMSIRGDAKPVPFIEDAAVPLEHLADYATQIRDFCLEAGVPQVAIYAHASAGCLHVRPLVNLKQPAGLRQMRQIAEKSIDLVVQFEGTTSGEHGEGLARGEFSERLFGPELVQAFREVKSAFDPRGLLNPGKVVDVSRMDDESLLRFGSDYAIPLAPTSTVLSFEADQGFHRAVEMCNGAGVCRKLGEGVMCPSYMVTRDEAHSTRGRANALRAAMMGLLGPEGMTSRELYGVLDLCLSCQACKRECPSGVDMARLKAEFLHGYHRRHGTPLRSRLFAHVASLNRLAQPLGWRNRSYAARALALAALGIHPPSLAAVGHRPQPLVSRAHRCAAQWPPAGAHHRRAPGGLLSRYLHRVPRAPRRTGGYPAARSLRIPADPGRGQGLLWPPCFLQGAAGYCSHDGYTKRTEPRTLCNQGCPYSGGGARLHQHAHRRVPRPGAGSRRGGRGRRSQPGGGLSDAGGRDPSRVQPDRDPRPLPRSLPAEGQLRHGGRPGAPGPPSGDPAAAGGIQLLWDGRVLWLRAGAL